LSPASFNKALQFDNSAGNDYRAGEIVSGGIATELGVIKEITMRTTIILALVICCSITGCSKKQETPPIQTLLDTFSEAVANRNIESIIGLFVAPDGTPEGQNRQNNIDEMKKDWANASKPAMAISFSNVKFDNESHLEADMSVADASVGNARATMKFEVRLLNNEWKIVTMNFEQ
jgi:hypothetical protein